jgi:hypothetical protein
MTDHHHLQRHQKKHKVNRDKELHRTSYESRFPSTSSSNSTNAMPTHSNVTHWLLLAANPRPVSFFGNPRFRYFSSGRHIIKIASMQFKNLFPNITKRQSIKGGDGKLHLIVVSNLLATLVPETSPHFTTMKEKAAHHQAPYADLWHATHDISSVNMVG